MPLESALPPPLPFELPEYFPILDLVRKDPSLGTFVDQRFYGIAALYGFSSSGEPIELAKFGNDNGYPFFLRSLLKPIQASIMAELKTAEFFNFTNSELAVMQASHSGETCHTSLVQSILKKIGLSEESLKCPPDKPLNPNVLSENQAPSGIHNNCSGKHSMMLAVSKQMGWDIEGYTDINHPVQKLIKAQVLKLSEIDNAPQTVDGCTVPVWALSLKSIAKCFYKLYNLEEYRFLKDAYCSDPYITGGTDVSGLRQDTLIMKLNPKLIAKTGAGGFLGVYNSSAKQFLLIKMAQDNNKARFLTVARLLTLLSWVPEPPAQEVPFPPAYPPDYNFYDEKMAPAGRFEVSENLCKIFLQVPKF